MTTNTYQTALDAAERELEDLLKNRAEIDKRVVTLRETIASLRRLCDDSGTSRATPASKDMGFTEAVREVLKSADRSLSPREVRDKLTEMGFDLRGYQNPLATVHVILKRLTKAGEARGAKTTLGTWTYWWLSPKEGEE